MCVYKKFFANYKSKIITSLNDNIITSNYTETKALYQYMYIDIDRYHYIYKRNLSNCVRVFTHTNW